MKGFLWELYLVSIPVGRCEAGSLWGWFLLLRHLRHWRQNSGSLRSLCMSPSLDYQEYWKNIIGDFSVPFPFERCNWEHWLGLWSLLHSLGGGFPLLHSSRWALGCRSLHLCQNAGIYGRVLSTVRESNRMPDVSISRAHRRCLWKDKITIALNSEQPFSYLPDFLPKEQHWLLWGNHNRRTVGAEGTCSYGGYTKINKGIFVVVWMAKKWFLEVCLWKRVAKKYSRADQFTLLVCSAFSAGGWVSPLLLPGLSRPL